MIRIAVFVCLVFLVVSLPACEKQNRLPLTATAQPSAEKRELPPPGPKVEACSLLSKEEVAAIKATMTDPAPADGDKGEFFLSQCNYGSKEPNMSVSIAVVERTTEFLAIRRDRILARQAEYADCEDGKSPKQFQYWPLEYGNALFFVTRRCDLY